MNIAANGLYGRADEAEQCDGHADVHEKLAAALIGTDGEKTADSQRQADPQGDERSGMQAARADVAGQTENYQ